MFDGKAFGLEVVGVVKAHVEKSLAPILARLDGIEQRFAALPIPKDGEPGKDGKDADIEEVKGLIEEAMSDVNERYQNIEARWKATNATLDEMKAAPPMIDAAEFLESKNQIIARTAEGEEKVTDLERLMTQLAANIAQFEKQYQEKLAEAAEKAVSAIEKPKDGAPGVDGKDGAPGVEGPRGKDGKDGRDGCDIADAMQDKDGNLVVTFTDGRIKTIGNIQGKDGVPGKDGTNGKDGADGIGFDSVVPEVRDDAVYLVGHKGDQVVEVRTPMPIYRGVWKEGTEYFKGNSVTWGGSSWIALTDAPEGKPDSGKGWLLSNKKGRDGKDGILKDPPKGGPVKVG